MNSYIDTVEAVRRLADNIADHASTAPAPVPWLAYLKRESAITMLYAAFCDGELAAWVRSAAAGPTQLLGMEWKTTPFWREIIIGGLVRASAGEPWLRYEGEAVLLEAAAFQTWREQRLKPPTAASIKAPRGTAGWIADEARRMKAAGKIPPDIRITAFAKLLAERMHQAAKSDSSLRPVAWRHIKNQLGAWGLWPITSIR